MPDQNGGYFARFQSAQSDMEATRNRLRLSEQRRAELLRQIEGEEPVFGIMTPSQSSNSSGGYTNSKIRQLETELDELRLQYTDKHPRIIQILDGRVAVPLRDITSLASFCFEMDAPRTAISFVTI